MRRTGLEASSPLAEAAICANRVRLPLDRRRSGAVLSRLRRARSASRTKPHRAAVRGSGKSVGVADESETGSAKPWSGVSLRQGFPVGKEFVGSCRAYRGPNARDHRKECLSERRIQRARAEVRPTCSIWSPGVVQLRCVVERFLDLRDEFMKCFVVVGAGLQLFS
jgi:hypothetical protein